MYVIRLETEPGLHIINNYIAQLTPDLKRSQSEIKELVSVYFIKMCLKKLSYLKNIINLNYTTKSFFFFCV